MYEKIKLLCEQKGIKISRLEGDLGLPHSIYRWDTHSPSIDKVKAVADYFGVSVDYLLRDESDPEEEKTLEQILQDAFESRPEMRILFSLSQNATKEEVEQTIKIIEALRK